MRATLDYVKAKFDQFNRQMFAGKLPPLPIELSNAKTFLGMCVCRRRKHRDGRVELFDFRLRINTRIDLPEQEVEDTIIHEMIHYYIGYFRLSDSSAHGPTFRRIMNTINERYGRHIRISHKTTAEQKAQAIDSTPRWHVVVAIRFVDGRFGVKVIPRSVNRIILFYNTLKLVKEIAHADMYLTNEPYFNRFPNSYALRIQYVDKAEVMAHLKEAIPVLCDGKSLKRGDKR